MLRKCSKTECTAPKGLCDELINQEFQKCKFWIATDSVSEKKKEKVNKKGNIIPWTGLALQPDQIEMLSHRSTPLIIGTIGASNAGKTSYLGMLYTLLFNGKKFQSYDFVGSQTLIAWETLAKYLKIKSNGKVDFPDPTPSNPDYYSLYHMALRQNDVVRDILFADSSGEVFTIWSNDINDSNAENARWIYENADGFIFFVDSEAVITGKGKAKLDIVQLAGQVSADLRNRPIVIVWSKSDLKDEIIPNIKEAITLALKRFFPNARSIEISNFSSKDPDTLCHKNNLEVTEQLLNELFGLKNFPLLPEVEPSDDPFFNFNGGYASK